jgi:uncharacterized SAM-binding protein YcdF (DUF218 family)
MLRTLVEGLVVTLFMLAAVIVADFLQRLEPRMAGAAAARTAVVFTGQFDRIDTALALFEADQVDQMLISGVGPGSGLRPETLADQFNFSPRARAALRSGEIQLSSDPVDTFQNAAETACWLGNPPPQGGVILVTSVSHMPRASITLERALPAGTMIFRATPAQTAIDTAALQTEFGKFVYSWLYSLTPSGRRPAPHLTLCATR